MDKAIKITKGNAVEIQAALRAVNGKATAHTFTSYEEIAAMAESAEKRVLELLGKKDAVGAKWAATSGDKVSSSYKHARIGTHVVLARRSTGWFLTNVIPATLFAEGGWPGKITLTEQQAELAIKRFQKGFHIAA